MPRFQGCNELGSVGMWVFGSPAQTENRRPQGRGLHRQGTLETDRQAFQDVYTCAVRQLLSTCWLWIMTRIKWKTPYRRWL